MPKYELPKLKTLQWHDADWVAKPYQIPHGYTISRVDQPGTLAEFVCETDMKRVVKLWNSTRHLSDIDLGKILGIIELQLEEFTSSK